MSYLDNLGECTCWGLKEFLELFYAIDTSALIQNPKVYAVSESF